MTPPPLQKQWVNNRFKVHYQVIPAQQLELRCSDLTVCSLLNLLPHNEKTQKKYQVTDFSNR